jgi:peptidoglycan/xylan/chitin deacetylase (PgdA/CDA1 family)
VLLVDMVNEHVNAMNRGSLLIEGRVEAFRQAVRAAKPEGVIGQYIANAVMFLAEDGQRRVVAEGHEIVIHGWIHELNSQLPYEIERD